MFPLKEQEGIEYPEGGRGEGGLGEGEEPLLYQSPLTL